MTLDNKQIYLQSLIVWGRAKSEKSMAIKAVLKQA